MFTFIFPCILNINNSYTFLVGCECSSKLFAFWFGHGGQDIFQVFHPNDCLPSFVRLPYISLLGQLTVGGRFKRPIIESLLLSIGDLLKIETPGELEEVLFSSIIEGTIIWALLDSIAGQSTSHFYFSLTV